MNGSNSSWMPVPPAPEETPPLPPAPWTMDANAAAARVASPHCCACWNANASCAKRSTLCKAGVPERVALSVRVAALVPDGVAGSDALRVGELPTLDDAADVTLGLGVPLLVSYGDDVVDSLSGPGSGGLVTSCDGTGCGRSSASIFTETPSAMS